MFRLTYMQRGSVVTKVERESVEAYVKDHIAEWLEASHPSPAERRLDLIERVVRVEEAIERLSEMIKHQGEMIKYQGEMTNKRFEAMDKRFEDIIGQMDKRFSELREDMNRRFSTMQWTMFFGFTLIGLMITVYRFLGTTG